MTRSPFLRLNASQPTGETPTSEPAQHHAINFIDFTTTDIAKTQRHFTGTAFGWNFQDYGPDYIAFDRDHAGIDGGFQQRRADAEASNDTAPLVVPLLAGSSFTQ